MGNVVALNTFFQQQFGDPVKSDDDRKNDALSIQSDSQKRPAGYNSWAQMKQRCDNPNSKSFVGYGGRGITYVPQWASFDKFVADMGPPPSKAYSLERIDSNGNYEPTNCKWASKTEQARNRCTTQRVVYDGKLYALAELAERYDISLSTLKARLRAGRSLADALHDPVERGGDRGGAHQRRQSEFDCWPSGLPEKTLEILETAFRSSPHARWNNESRPQFFLRYTEEYFLRFGENLCGVSPDEVDPITRKQADALAAAREEARILLDRLG
jgi:hypothetical protein